MLQPGSSLGVASPGPDTKRRSRLRPVVVSLACLVVLGLGGGSWYYFSPHQVSSSGGLFFPRRELLNVPRFAQGDPRWSAALLGPTDGTMGGEGCAVSSAAMVLAFYGADIDPGRLNTYLSEHDGYTPQGWLFWEKAAAFPTARAKHAYENLPSYYLIDLNLMQGNPVIVRIRLPGGTTHFVVIVGKDGWNYLIQDPSRRGEAGPYPLCALSRKIEGLRFYQRLL